MVLKDAGTVRTIIYACTAKDQVKGNDCVHAVPSEFEQIKNWLCELDLGIKYTGQGLPAISAQVLLLLVKRGKSRLYLTGEEKAELLELLLLARHELLQAHDVVPFEAAAFLSA